MRKQDEMEAVRSENQNLLATNEYQQGEIDRLKEENARLHRENLLLKKTPLALAQQLPITPPLEPYVSCTWQLVYPSPPY